MWHRHNIDPEQLKQAGIDRATVRRAWGFARPYRGRIALYVGVLIANAVASVLPPLIFRVADPAVLGQVKAGDATRFRAEKIDAALTVTRLDKKDGA